MKKHLIWTNYELEEDRKGYPELEEDEQEKLLQEMIADRDNLYILVDGEILAIANLAMVWPPHWL